MTTFQLLMLAATAFFAFRVYEHINALQDPPESTPQRDSFSPIDPESLMEKADKAFAEEDFKRAAALLQEASVKAPQNSEILNKLGFVLAKNGDLKAAIEVYLKSLLADNNDDMTHSAIASLYRRTSEFDKAKEHYEKAIEIDAEYAVTYYNYANLLVQLGENGRAAQLYEKALEIDSDFDEAREELEKLSS
ncbi:MAG: tetratricopeptide repeat protein [Campylobacterota bacterium]|nr:tetratricopeptide repeat protein [Campylobacterota bacterium]